MKHVLVTVLILLTLGAVGVTQSLTVTPSSVTLSPGGTQQFTASQAGARWTATGGVITSTGFYTAGSTAGTYSVRARVKNQDGFATVIISAPPPPPPPSEWTFCANEGEQCAFTGIKEVRYGANGAYFYRTLTDGTPCTNEVFGDPIEGVVKQCHYRNPPSTGCGEDVTRWHPSVVNGCETGHEHGDAPPAWVETSGQHPHFTHPGNTPNENVLKHTSFKGYHFTHPRVSVEAYALVHNDGHPNGQQTRFHSVQIWARDPQGGISYWAQWMDFNVGNATGSQIRPAVSCGSQFDVRPVIAVNFPECQLIFENWYPHETHLWGWDLGLNSQAHYYGGPKVGTYSSGLLEDAGSWLPTGQFNTARRIELAFYRDRFNQTGAPTNQIFYGTQFGQLVSGPSDPVCGTSVVVGARTYTVACLPIFVAATMPTFSYPDNAYQNTWACPNCRLPN